MQLKDVTQTMCKINCQICTRLVRHMSRKMNRKLLGLIGFVGLMILE